MGARAPVPYGVGATVSTAVFLTRIRVITPGKLMELKSFVGEF